MEHADTKPFSLANIEVDEQANKLICQGTWTMQYCVELSNHYQQLKLPTGDNIIIDGENIQQMDSTGAWLLDKIIAPLRNQQYAVDLQNFQPKQLTLLELIANKIPDIQNKPEPEQHDFIYRIGQKSIVLAWEKINIVNFIGQLTITFLETVKKAKNFPWRAIFLNVDNTGFQALPIIALLSFLIGVVLAYQIGVQLEQYGAEIYIVNLLGLSILREFGPLIAAIIVAGRTSSAFTAELGTMKINEEIDALQMMGVIPSEYLVLPKIIGLMISMPLLIVWADMFGIFGGMIMSKATIGMNLYDFISRFRESVDLKSYMIGLSKAPVFAYFIAIIGCFQGIQVRGGAESVGLQTTKSVVQSIFTIIVIDAIFSILCNWLRL